LFPFPFNSPMFWGGGVVLHCGGMEFNSVCKLKATNTNTITIIARLQWPSFQFDASLPVLRRKMERTLKLVLMTANSCQLLCGWSPSTAGQGYWWSPSQTCMQNWCPRTGGPFPSTVASAQTRPSTGCFWQKKSLCYLFIYIS
jgi:hypothetical protein